MPEVPGEDPRRRYKTANDLAGDLSRYLAGEPTLARPPGAVASGIRWAKRHRGLFVVFLLVVLAFLFGLTVSTVAAVRATQAEAKAEERADDLERVLTETGAAHERETVRLTEVHERELNRLREALRGPEPGVGDGRPVRGGGLVAPAGTHLWDVARHSG